MIDQLAPEVAQSRIVQGAMLLDVREPWEIATAQVAGSVVIPMRDIPQRLGELDRSADIICMCHHGMRSQQVAFFLMRAGFERVSNLSGGIDAWSRAVDPAVPRY